MKKFLVALAFLTQTVCAQAPVQVSIQNNTPYELQVWVEYGNPTELKKLATKAEYKEHVGLSEKIMVSSYKSGTVSLRNGTRSRKSSDKVVALKARQCKQHEDGVTFGSKVGRLFSRGCEKEHYRIELEDGMVVPYPEETVQDDMYMPSTFDF